MTIKSLSDVLNIASSLYRPIGRTPIHYAGRDQDEIKFLNEGMKTLLGKYDFQAGKEGLLITPFPSKDKFTRGVVIQPFAKNSSIKKINEVEEPLGDATLISLEHDRIKLLLDEKFYYINIRQPAPTSIDVRHLVKYLRNFQ